MTSGRSDLVDITGQIRRDTPKAVLLFDGTREVWLPKSQIEIGEPDHNGLVEIAMPEWLAIEKELV